MSCFAGAWNFDGKPVDRDLIAKLSDGIDQYGPDGGSTYIEGPLAITYRAFHTNKESRLERQPYVSRRGNVLVWDGRLDNREELIAALGTELDSEHKGARTDVAIAMAACERWGTDSFGKLLGDFALALWVLADRALIFAKDYVGPRRLFYEIRNGMIWWCTHLEPLILLSGQQYGLNDEYIASYFASFPATHLTPYVGVDAVPAGNFVTIKSGRAAASQFWRFDPEKRVRYKNDADYEEHFRIALGRAVKRRLRSDSPVLAELSGGYDSSSIVCVADELIAKRDAESGRLDTISYHDDDEPNLNERPYFTKVEQKRGRPGTHLDAAKSHGMTPLRPEYFSAVPGPDQNAVDFLCARLDVMRSQGNRILLSGIGGDEMTGGVPYATSELADLLVQWQLRDLFRKSKAWSMNLRLPWPHLLLETAKSCVLSWTNNERLPTNKRTPWLDAKFISKTSSAVSRSNQTTLLTGSLPSFRTNLHALSILQRQLANVSKIHRDGAKENCYELSFPYLDRDFVEFMLSVPRQQVLQPKQRRTLMRRALAGLVPEEILNRTRKAYVSRRPLATVGSSWRAINDLFTRPISAHLEIINRQQFCDTLVAAKHGNCTNILGLFLTTRLELWLRDLVARRVLSSASGFTEAFGEEKKVSQRSATQPSYL